MDGIDQERPGLDVCRTHQRFLLRQLHFTQQFAAMYFLRLQALKPRALERYGRVRHAHAECPCRRVLELEVGKPAYCIGTIFKHLKAYPRFLDEYQKELVRIELGEDDGDDDGGEGGGTEDNDGLGNADDGGAADTTLAAEATNFCTNADVLLLEDDSGRVELAGVDAHAFVSGMVVFAVGVLMEKGKFEVEHIGICGPSPQASIPRSLLSSTTPPVYVAFVSGLNVGCQGMAASAMDMLVDFLGGNLGDDALVYLASRVSRLVIGGNSIDVCDELRLKNKVKLDPSDHVRLNDTSAVNTSANCMRELDHVMASIADTVDVDLMPGENDPSNSFLPQQPLHPITLREACKRASLRLVTNPYELTVRPHIAATAADAAPQRPAVSVFVTSGANVSDIVRQSKWASPLDAMAVLLECACACPTAPNTLVCYPFQESDPFLFPQTPHVLVACNQNGFATRYQTIPGGAGAAEADGDVGCRLVSVPSFAKTGSIVLVNVAAPDFPTMQLQLG